MRSPAIAVLLASMAGCTLEFDRALLDRAGESGCTDGVNRLPGNTPEACGTGGGSCAQCVSPLSACEAGACVVANAVVGVALGEAHSSALDRNGVLWLWGSNRGGNLGLPADVMEQQLPVALNAPGRSWFAAAMGGRIPELHSCAIADPGALYCWGGNGDGQTGLGSAQPGAVPAQVGTDSDWTAISAGSAFSCGIRAPGALYCWGYGGDSKRLGLDPEPADTRTPQRLPGADDWSQVSLSSGHGCAIKRDRSLWCWGENQFGQLGHSSGNAPPAQVKNGTSYRQVSAGDDHTCGIRDNGTLWCWGDNSSGQLGLAASTGEPLQVGTGSDWTRVTAGGRHTCALRGDHSVWCWGSGEYGQIGSGSFVDSPMPAAVEGSDWTNVGAGVDHTCAVKRDGTLWCWGGNYVSQLGTRGPGFEPVPAPVLVVLE